MCISYKKDDLMRKIILIAAALIICASLTSCDMINKISSGKTDATVGDKTEGTKIEESGAIATLISADSTSATVKIENNTDSTWQSGNMRDYTLEVEKDGEWYQVKQIGEYANTMELMIFAPGESITHTFSFVERYGNLTPGKYRVVKAYWANKTETFDAHEFHVVCEFAVE